MKKAMIALVIVSIFLTGCASTAFASDTGTEDIETLASLEEIGIRELEVNWPESVRYHADGVYANPLCAEIEIDTPVTLLISCVTMDGSLRLKIVNDVDEEVCFEEKNPDGDYKVEIDKAGTYRILFYAKEHGGSVEIVPERN